MTAKFVFTPVRPMWGNQVAVVTGLANSPFVQFKAAEYKTAGFVVVYRDGYITVHNPS